jgi:orotate phosphoribosyltransferase
MKSIANILVEHNIVRTNFTNPFVWASGIHSPIYCDCRELMSLTDARNEIVDGFIELIKKENLPTDSIAGTATAGIPWAAFVAERLAKPMLYVRAKPKDHGAGKMVEGRGEQGKNILVVEDAISTGGSSITSAIALRNELNATVAHILGIFTWSTPKVAENEMEHHVKFHTLTAFAEIAEALEAAGKITTEERASLERFHDNPREWWGK